MFNILNMFNQNSKGKVYIASMNLRGTHAQSPPNTIKINVTSAQSKTNKNRLCFSPMTEIDGGYKGFYNFESYWQSGKVYEDIDKEITKTWWMNNKLPKRRYPNSKNKKVLFAEFDDYPNEQMDYITSRKKIYVPKYYDLIKEKEITKYWQKMVNSGTDVVVYDFDGPRKPNGDVECVQISKELLINKINDSTFPFGHGYIVAGLLCDLLPNDYL